ncbi:YciI family protein [Actinophytocola oryzae]|uniref:YCII-related domain-containing protein n=1 Tax=Actinophytocola oryzae TaxID=502181 RepID=A0A4R7VVS1_9PSEU|nr:YciI family protein [Actinophytocola oryzae]TDV54123.1 hypothetical protein CLV71_104592 [Actinophytocola oryzae]
MKYLVMIYGNPRNWEHPMFRQDPGFLALSPEERDVVAREADELWAEIEQSGEFVAGVALADPALTRHVRGRDGVPVTTDGPYLEAKEQLAGYFVLDCETPERAAELAARFPDARFAAVEVRPIMDMAGQEM